jgi:hypothetical protein
MTRFSLTRRGWAPLVFAALLAAAVVVVLGRVEANHAIDHQLAGIDAVRRQVVGERPAAYRLTPTLYCLLYRRGGNRFAYELCYDHSGGLVEAVDRRTASPSFWSVAYDPTRARDVVSTRALSDQLRRLRAFVHLDVPPGVLPTGLDDTGPHVAGAPYVSGAR